MGSESQSKVEGLKVEGRGGLRNRVMHVGLRNGVEVTKWETDRVRLVAKLRRMARNDRRSKFAIRSQVFLEKGGAA